MRTSSTIRINVPRRQTGDDGATGMGRGRGMATRGVDLQSHNYASPATFCYVLLRFAIFGYVCYVLLCISILGKNFRKLLEGFALLFRTILDQISEHNRGTHPKTAGTQTITEIQRHPSSKTLRMEALDQLEYIESKRGGEHSSPNHNQNG